MKPVCRNSVRAVTRLEVLVVAVVVVAFVFAVLVLLPLSRVSVTAYGIWCANNLKQVGLSFRLWAGDHDDKFPTQISTNLGGAMEPAMAGNPVPVFRAMSEELATPRILTCPKDLRRPCATNFLEGFSRDNISYFTSLDATATNLAAFLCGDRNLTNNLPVRGRILEVPTSQIVGWSNQAKGVWMRYFAHESKIPGHGGLGYIVLTDGEVPRLNSSELNQALQNSGVVTNRLVMP